MSTPERRQRLLDLLYECDDPQLAIARWEAEGRETSQLPDGVMLDDDRAGRCGFHEVIFAQGKPAATLVRIFRKLGDQGRLAFATRVSPGQAAVIRGEFPSVIDNPVARTLRMPPQRAEPAVGYVPILAAGTSDLPVAEEALETLKWMNCNTRIVADVGVAGPQRLIQSLPALKGADAIVVVAGMEGALPSVVGGWVDCPVIAVPTSVGYGANFGGVSALLSMLNCCAPNVAVVNIDAGFKAAYLAGMIAHRIEKAASEL
jgi:NCAIR mutase (PurE)-related protein